ncbi:MAG: outer membrane beta-barrel protein [Pseudomonadota bacterium]
MNHFIKASGLASFVLLSSLGVAQAEDQSSKSYYVSVFGGGNFAGDLDGRDILNFVDISGSVVGTVGLDTEIETDAGFIAGAAFGTEFDHGIRVEGEYAFLRNTFDEVVGNVVSATGAAAGFTGPLVGAILGDIKTHSILVNAWKDFSFEGSPIVPYIGGGAGFGISSFNFDGLASEETEVGFAFQVGAGVDAELDSGVRLGVGYRFYGFPNAEFPIDSVTNTAVASGIYSQTVIGTVTIPFR